jgi:hypothetical protein
MFNFFKRKITWEIFAKRNAKEMIKSRVGKLIKQGACSNSVTALTKGVQNIRG